MKILPTDLSKLLSEIDLTNTINNTLVLYLSPTVTKRCSTLLKPSKHKLGKKLDRWHQCIFFVVFSTFHRNLPFLWGQKDPFPYPDGPQYKQMLKYGEGGGRTAAAGKTYSYYQDN